MTQTHAEWADARAERDAKERKRYEASIKPGKPILYRFGDDVVTLTKLPMEYDYPAGGTFGGAVPSGPKWKSKYLVTLNGVERGFLVCQNGWGSVWEVVTLADDRSGVVKTVRARGVDAKDALASAIPDLVRQQLLPTADERAAMARGRAVSILARTTQHAAQLADHVGQLIMDQETLAGLMARGVLSNSEADVVGRLIEEMAGQLRRERGSLKDAQERVAKAEQEAAARGAS